MSLYSCGLPSVLLVLCCSPSVGHAALDIFDELLCIALSYLPMRPAGLPIDPGQPPVYLSEMENLESGSHVLPFWFQRIAPGVCRTKSPSTVCANLMTTHTLWSASFGAPLTRPATHRYEAWDRPCTNAIEDELQSVLTSPRQKSSFLAATAPHSGYWLNALPIACCGLRMDDESVRVVMALNLGLGK